MWKGKILRGRHMDRPEPKTEMVMPIYSENDEHPELTPMSPDPTLPQPFMSQKKC